MKNLKKTLLVICLFSVSLLVIGCGKKDILTGSLEDIMKSVYDGASIPTDKMPKLNNTELTKENLENFLGVKDLDFKEGLVSEPFMGSYAHSVVLVRMNEGADIEKAKKEIKEKVNPRKWICVWVEDENVLVESRGDVIILIIDNDYSKNLSESFKNVKNK